MRATRRIVLLAALLGQVLLACIASAQQPASPVVTAAPPAGFEDLEKPQSTLLDIIFLGRAIQGVPATFDPQFTTFEKPLDLIARLPEVANSEPVLRALSQPLPNNAGLLCRRQKEQDEECGRLAPQVAGIILDANRFRAELFINPAYLKQGTTVDKFLPPPSSGEFVFMNLDGALAGSHGSEAQYSLRQETIVGRGANRLVANTQKSESGPFNFDALRAERDDGVWRYSAGLFRNRPISAISDMNLIGLSANTQTDTLVDKGLADPNQLSIFLPRRSQVRVIRDGRLLFSQIYEAGNQMIDPRLLPDGAYEVVLQITEAGGVTREERRFFVKQEAIPTVDLPFWFFDIGRLARFTGDSMFPEVTTIPVGRAGTRRRVSQGLALGGDAVVSSEDALGEFSVIDINRDWLGRYAAFGTTNKDFGLSANFTATMGSFNLSGGLRQVWSGGRDDDFGILRELTTNQTQASAAIFYAVGDGSVGVRSTVTRREEAPNTWSVGPNFRYPVLQFGVWQLDFLADAEQSNRETFVFFRLNLRANTFSESLSLTSGYQGVSERGSSDPRNRSGFVNRADASRTFQNMLDDDDLTLSAGIGREPQRSNLTTAADYRHARGRANGAIDFTNSSAQSYTNSYNLNVATNLLGGGLLSAGERDFSFGGADQGDAGIIVAIRGDAPGNEFVVYVDGAIKGRLRAGERRTIIAPSYKTYDVRIASLGGGNVHYDNNSRRVTVYPGNVATAVWTVQTVVPAFGRIMKRNGQPFTFARVEGAVEPSFTDDLGYFQVEVPETTVLRFQSQEENCTVPVELPKDRPDFVRLGTLTCQ
jgi:hypothetical protein